MKFLKIRDVKTPQRGTSQSAGIDFFIPNDHPTNNMDKSIFVQPGQSALIPSGIKAKVPQGYALVAMNKSGVATKKGLAVGACVVDEDYQGEIHLHVVNVGDKTVTLEPGEKLVQMLLIPVFYAIPKEVNSEEELFGGEQTDRGQGGFGSTGSGRVYKVNEIIMFRLPYEVQESRFKVISEFKADNKDEILKNLNNLTKIESE